MTTCPFCSAETPLARNDLSIALRDGFPVNPGHTLIVPLRHVGSWFETTNEEQRAMMELLLQMRAQIDAELQPDGYNIGINVGEAAGQTVSHVHIHLIPRFANDVDDPTGGVRLVVPERGNYRRPGVIPRAGQTDFTS